ncbi:MAG: putative Sec-independent protein translocase protein TatB [Actinomycetota bacterium]|jgi:sec-independent protein translocase protein TatB
MLCRASYAEAVFNLSGSEIVFLLVVGLVVLGPERLPGVLRTVGKTYGDLRRMARGFEQEMKSGFEQPIKDLRETAEGIKKTAFGEIDPEPSPPMRPEQAVRPPDSPQDGPDA